MIKRRWLAVILTGLLLPCIFSPATASADAQDDMVNTLREYYAICQREDIQAYMAIMDLSEADSFPLGHVENTRQLALDVWATYNILDVELSEIETVVDEAGEFGLIKYHLRQLLEGPDTAGAVKTTELEIDYIALMHNTGTWQVVYLMPEAVAALKAHRRRYLEERMLRAERWEETWRENPKARDLVFPSRTGGPMNRDNLLKRYFKPLAREAGLPEEATLYTLRHTFATLWLESGENPKVLQEILGHSRIDVTLNVYSHVLPHIQHDAMDRFGRRFFGRS